MHRKSSRRRSGLFSFSASAQPRHAQSQLALNVEQLEGRAMLAGDLVISEFLADNAGGLVDQDNEHSDWIEIHNTTAASISLNNWYLTDSASNKTKWQFPNVSIAGDGYLVVFASSKNRAIAGSELHTNFSLSAAGEYLGLVQPNGTTVEYEYTPTFPAQHPDISYGIGQSVTVDSLLTSPATAKVFVPTNNTLGTSWTAEGFNDAGWTSGSTGVGYEVLVPGFAVKNYKANVVVDSLAKAEEVIGTPGMQTSVVAANTPTINFLGGGASAHYGGDTGFPGRALGQDIEDFVIEANAKLTIPSAGFWTFGVNSDDGFSVAISQNGGAPFTFSFPSPRGPADTLAAFNFPAAGVYDVRLVMYERGGGDEVEFFAAPGNRSAWDAGNFDLVGDVANGGLKVESTITSVNSSNYRSLISTDLQTAVFGINASAYIRIPFNVSDPNAFSTLSLRMKYDDGFVAYLNGTPVASRNAPASPTYNSTATVDRQASLATTFEDINITSFLNLLHAGTNVLAIQALNDSATSNDFLVVPELAQLTTVTSAQRFFTQPTPGSVNNSAGVIDFVSPTTFNYEHGFYESAFDLTIATTTPGATIRYTLDGSAPSETNGTIYTGPIHIVKTTAVRAIAYKAGFEPTVSQTQSYVFLDNVLTQTRPTGYPVNWNAGVGDYDMDPNVVNNPAYAATIKNDLQTIPSMSLVMDLADIFGPQGIYSNPTQEGAAWEKPGSFEMMNPDGSEGFQINAGVRMYGGVGRYEQFRKHSFRIIFKDDYGPSKLDFPLFPDSTVTKFDSLILRAGFNNSWHRQSAGEEQQAEYIQDQFIRDTQLDMGEPGSHGRFVNLYINGLYWGVYNVVERPDASFAAQTLGGDKANWDALNSSNPVDGDRAAWDTLMGLINAGVTTQAQYDAVKQYLDVDNLIDYMIVNFYGGNLDWDDHNWYAARERVPGAGFKFFSWDSERTLESVNEYRLNVGQADKPSAIYAALRNNAEFRLDFADRIYKHLFNDGALTPENAAERFAERKAEIDRAIVGESARWGDASRSNAYTRDVEWIAEINRLNTSYFPQRTGILLAQFKGDNLYPNVDAPTMSQHGGTFAGTLPLTLTAPAGTIYYTLDGSDPRLVGGALAPGAIAYSGAINLTGHATIRARTLSGATWSALDEAEFAPDVSKLRVTEVMYNPLAGGGYTSNDMEYIELQNTGAVSINLQDTRFAAGVDYTFGNVSIAAGQRIILAKNPAAFNSRYPGVTVTGAYTGTLDNSGEQLLLQDALGTAVLDFKYQTDWYPITNGQGFSLVVINPAAAATTWNTKASWRASQFTAGNPGLADAGLNPDSVVVSEVLSNTADGVLGDRIELHNTTGAAIDISGWWLSDSTTQPSKYQIQPGTIIPAGGYLAFSQLQQFGLPGAPGVATPFDLNSAGELVYLSSSDGLGNLAGYRAEEDFGASEAEVSFGLYTKSTGGTDFVAQSVSTFGAANAYPKVGPVVINEVMYNPAPGGDEFIELLNITASPVPLYDPANPADSWQFTKGVTFAFPTGGSAVTLPAGGYALVVGIDPAVFRTKYNIPGAVPIFGPYVGALDNAGETLELSKPGVPTAPGVFPLIAADAVKYQPDAPWSTSPNGNGPALFRFAASQYGNDVVNWQPSTTGGTPGALNVGQDATPPSVPSGVIATVVNTTRIDLTWNASVDPHTGVARYRVFRGGIEIGSPTSPAFSDTTAVAGVTYSYEISAVNGDGFESAKSSAVVTTILGLTSVTTTDNTHVQVKFTGTVQPASATNTANYTIGGGVTVLGAALGGDGRTVTLTTSALVNDTTYTLSVSNVTSTTGTVLPAATQRNFTAGQGVGLRGEYYNNIDFTGTLLVRTDPTVDFGWGNGSPDPSMDPDSFSVRWTGFVRPLYSETYNFYTTSDDGVRLWVNGQQIINNFGDHGDTEDTGTITLVGGQRYTIRMEFYENGGGATARLFWSSPTQTKQAIPQTQLFLPPDISIADVSAIEGNSGGKNFVFAVNLTTSTTDIVTVNYATAGQTAISPSDFTSLSGTLTFNPGETSKNITVVVNGDTTPESTETFALNLSSPTNASLGDTQAIGTIVDDDNIAVVGRRVFYNNSKFDGNTPLAGASDDAAIASDKAALLPGGMATFANYTSYSRGINGVMIDISHLAGTPTVGDFSFKVGNSNTPGSWAAAPAPQSITVRAGAGTGGSDRVTIIWPDGAILKQWLQVTVAAGGNIGLAAPDVFYFGNAVGEVGGSANAQVNSTDEIAARGNPRSFLDPAPISAVHDFNRDGFVNATDQILARSNSTSLATALSLITVPGGFAPTSSPLDMLAAALATPTSAIAAPPFAATFSSSSEGELPAHSAAQAPAAGQTHSIDGVFAAWDEDLLADDPAGDSTASDATASDEFDLELAIGLGAGPG